MTSIQRVLVVDDDATILRVSRSFLERLEIEVHQAGSGNAARALVEGGLEPDIVLTDLNMPDGSGSDLLAFLRSREASAAIPVVVITGSTDPTEIDEVWRLGCTEVYRKPVHYPELLDRVAEHLGIAVRRAQRHRVDLAVNLQLDDRVEEGRATDLSSTGVFLASTAQLEPRSVLEIVLRLPFPTGAELVTLNVEVVRQERCGELWGHGARFLPGSGESRRLLEDYLGWLSD